MEWRPIEGWPYQVSDNGRVRRVGFMRGKAPKELRARRNKDGYLEVNLSRDGVCKMFKVHRLVCVAFHGAQPSPRHQIAHADNNPANNRSANVRWALPSENTADKRSHGTIHNGAEHYGAILSEDDVRAIRCSKFTQASLARQYGVNWRTVWAVLHRKTWAHL